MKLFYTILIILLPILILGQNHKVIITNKNGQVHSKQYKDGKLQKFKLFNASDDSIFVLNKQDSIFSFSLNDVQDPRLLIPNLTTYITIFTKKGNEFSGKLIDENLSTISIDIGFNNIVSISKSNVLRQYEQYIPMRGTIITKIQTGENAYVKGTVITVDSNYLFLQTKYQTVPVPNYSIQSEKLLYQPVLPYSFGISIFSTPYEIVPSLDFSINLWTRQKYTFGIHSRFFIENIITIGVYARKILSHKSSLRLDVATVGGDDIMSEIMYKRYFGKRKQFYATGGLGLFSFVDAEFGFDFDYTYLRIGTGYRFSF